MMLKKTNRIFAVNPMLQMLGALLLGSLTFVTVSQAGGWPANQEPDMILHNAVILTMEPGAGTQQAIAIRQEKIMAVGSDEQVLRLQGRRTQVIDMRGHTIMPGLVDAHTHLFNDFTEQSPNMSVAQQRAIENGITTLANMYATPEIIANIRAFKSNLKVRTSVYMSKTTNCGVVDSDWYLAYPPSRVAGERFRIGGIKLFTDGGTCGQAAVSVERVPGQGLGNLFFSQDGLNELVKVAHQAGYQVAIHAIGDRGIEQALNAIEFVLDGKPNHLRHRIEHSAVLTKESIARFGELGVVPTLFGYKRTCWLPEDLPLFYQQTENAHRSLLEKNPDLHVAWHGDDPWVEPLNPFIDMYSLATRIDVISDDAPCKPPRWLAQQALSVPQILKMMTISSAYALGRDQEVGSLVAGKYADLIVLSANPLVIELDEIRHIQVQATMIGGKVLFSNLLAAEVPAWSLAFK